MKELIETLAVYTYIIAVAAMALMWVAANKDTEKKPARRNNREENSEPFMKTFISSARISLGFTASSGREC